MGNQKFKLSDMVPNAWFYKLKDMSKPSKTTTSAAYKLKNRRLPPPEATPIPLLSPPEPEYQPRKSYHFSRDLNLNLPPTMEDPPLLLSPPRKSKSSTKSRKSTTAKRTTTGGGGGDGCTCRPTATIPSHRSKSPPSPAEPDHHDPGFSSDPVKNKPGHFDIVIDVDNYKLDPNATRILESLTTQSYKFNGIDFRLPKIITKPRNSNSNSNPNSNSIKEEKPVAPPSRRFSGGSPATGVRLKVNSPRIMARKSGNVGGATATAAARRSVRKRRSISESFAVVKSSNDPQKDFRESMVEMIVQNNLRASKDLEDLLACYLSLNSDEYHEVIIKVFKQIWFDLTELKHKKFVLSQQ